MQDDALLISLVETDPLLLLPDPWAVSSLAWNPGLPPPLDYNWATGRDSPILGPEQRT